MFCPKCGSILKPKKDGSKRVLACSCGFVNKDADTIKLTEELKPKKRVEVIGDEELETLPKMEVTCPKCTHNTAYFWTQQTRASDEPETKFLKCEKCKHTWRDYN